MGALTCDPKTLSAAVTLLGRRTLMRGVRASDDLGAIQSQTVEVDLGGYALMSSEG